MRVGMPELPVEQLTDAHFMANIDVSQPLHAVQADHTTSFHLENVPGAVEAVPTKLTYLQDGEGDIVLTWRFEAQFENNWYEAHVQATRDSSIASAEPDVLSVVDWQKDFRGISEPSNAPVEVLQKHDDDEDDKAPAPRKPAHGKPEAPATYRVFGWGTNDPTEGDRVTLENPHDVTASPHGWHDVPAPEHATAQFERDWHLSRGWSAKLRDAGAAFADTRGNNVFAQANPSGGSEFELNYRPADAARNFSFPLGWGCKFAHQGCKGRVIAPSTYINASITELFYTVNMLHDLSYRYGFDEPAGNFQERNFGGKGRGNDAVIANAQARFLHYAWPLPDSSTGRKRHR
jgi:extracellular elastinolytic metalloproteinase